VTFSTDDRQDADATPQAAPEMVRTISGNWVPVGWTISVKGKRILRPEYRQHLKNSDGKLASRA